MVCGFQKFSKLFSRSCYRKTQHTFKIQASISFLKSFTRISIPSGAPGVKEELPGLRGDRPGVREKLPGLRVVFFLHDLSFSVTFSVSPGGSIFRVSGNLWGFRSLYRILGKMGTNQGGLLAEGKLLR